MEEEKRLEILRELEAKIREGAQKQAEAVEMLVEMGEMPVMPLDDLDDYSQYVEMGGQERLPEVLTEELGLDLGAEPVSEYEFDADSDEAPGVKVQVKVFGTNRDDVYLGRYEDTNGVVNWVLRSREVEEGV